MFFNKNRITYRKLNVEDAKSAALLYSYACRYDKYFTEVFGKDSVEEEILHKFSPDVMNAIKYGDSYGAFNKGELVGLVLAFNITDWRHNHTAELKRIFDGSTVLLDSVTEFIKEQNTDILYVFAICVHDEQRCKGIAKTLIRNLCKQFDSKYSIVSDAMHPTAMPMWLSNGFSEVRKGDYSFVIKV